MSKKTNPGARFTLVVEYDVDSIPSSNELDELIDRAREYGYVKQATWELLTLVKKELV